MDYRSSASFGKRQEYIAVARLLQLGFDVYMTLVDDQQIDCVVRLEKDRSIRYHDIQIKARSKEAKNAGTFAAMIVNKPRPDFWFIFYSEIIDTYWIIPSLDLLKLASVNKGGNTGKNTGKLTIVLANKTKTGWKPRPKFQQYVNAFGQLRS